MTGSRPGWYSTTARAGAPCTSRSGGCGCTPRCPPRRSPRRARGARKPPPGGLRRSRPRASSCCRRRTPGAGAAGAKPAPGVLEAIEAADFVLLPPSNPVVSIGIILAVPGIAEAVSAKTVVGVSPIIGGAPVRGMADACLTAIGVQTSAAAVAAHYGAGLLDGWLVDEQDKAAADAPELAGIAVRALPLYMTDLSASAEIAGAALALAAELTR